LSAIGHTGVNSAVNAVVEFEHLYVSVRDAEGRMLTDEQVKALPDVEKAHPLCKEWKIRKRSANRLLAWLQQKKKPLNILEIGCGNGWLSALLAEIPASTVTGLDINRVEIAQACQVFKKPRLEFIWDDFKPGLFLEEKFDVIVFAASMQYFKPLAGILRDALACLAPEGEIHITDTHFYQVDELAAAAGRTKNYYAGLGYPEMSDHYYQHRIDDIRAFNNRILVNPRTAINRVFKRKPFYWIVITH